MRAAKWIRLAGWCALGALVLQGMGVLNAPGTGIWEGGGFDYHLYLLALEPGLPGGVLPLPLEICRLHEAPLPPVGSSFSRPQAPRGPPA
jgi:hypothetical protein